MKSIKAKLMLYLGILLIVVCVGSGLVSYSISSNAMILSTKETLPQTARQAAKAVEARIQGKLTNLDVIASMSEIKDPNVPWNIKLPILMAEVKNLGYIKIGIADTKGNDQTTIGKSTQVNDREYFQKALSGLSYVSDPITSKIDNSLIIDYAVPIKNNDKIVGVLIATEDGNSLSNLISDITFGKTGKAYILNSKGTTIAHPDKSLVVKMDNIIDKAKKDPSLKELSALDTKMISDETGAGSYTYNGETKYLGYAPIRSLGWSLAIAAPENEVLDKLVTLKTSILFETIIFLLAALAIIFFIAKSFTNGIEASSKHLARISTGDFTVNINEKFMKSNDEIGFIAKSLKNTQNSIREMLSSIMNSSSNIDKQSENLASISEEMSASAGNVASAIQEVAKGTNSQAESLSDVTEAINTFGKALDSINSSINDVHTKSKNIGEMANNSSSEMLNLSESVNKLSNSFKLFIEKVTNLGNSVNQVNEITNLINSIADQTNMLALNAAIEAARAGEAGKGFSVVAEEIRNLAEKTKSSSSNISNLIGNISSETNEMVKNTSSEMRSQLNNEVAIINNAVESFKGIIDGVNGILPSIGEVKQSSESIEKQKNGILGKVESISAISEEVSASSEEISASTQQMNASAQEVAASAETMSGMMKDMMDKLNKFKI